MTTARYEVHAHYYGRPMITAGPASGCADFPKHKWVRLNERPLGLQTATRIAEEQPIHAIVTKWQSSEVAYSNSKSAGLPEGWLPVPEDN